MNLGQIDRYVSGMKETTQYAPDVLHNVPLSVTLKDKIKYHQDQISKLEATLDLLETNKDIEKLMFLLSEIH
jgi:hypothetical protein